MPLIASQQSFVPQTPTTMTLRQRLPACWQCQWAYHANTVTIWNQLEAGMHLYDALYRWARDGSEERHTWPTGKPS